MYGACGLNTTQYNISKLHNVIYIITLSERLTNTLTMSDVLSETKHNQIDWVNRRPNITGMGISASDNRNIIDRNGGQLTSHLFVQPAIRGTPSLAAGL